MKNIESPEIFLPKPPEVPRQIPASPFTNKSVQRSNQDNLWPARSVLALVDILTSDYLTNASQQRFLKNAAKNFIAHPEDPMKLFSIIAKTVGYEVFQDCIKFMDSKNPNKPKASQTNRIITKAPNSDYRFKQPLVSEQENNIFKKLIGHCKWWRLSKFQAPTAAWGRRSLVFDHKVVHVGGLSSDSHDTFKYLSVTNLWDLKTRVVTTFGHPPSQPLINHSINLVYFNKEYFFYIFGGKGLNNYFNDSLFILSIKTKKWKEISKDTLNHPVARDNHCSLSYPSKCTQNDEKQNIFSQTTCNVKSTELLFIFGGRTSFKLYEKAKYNLKDSLFYDDYVILNDLWCLQIANNYWFKVDYTSQSVIKPRMSSSIVWIHDDLFCIYGGDSCSTDANDVKLRVILSEFLIVKIKISAVNIEVIQDVTIEEEEEEEVLTNRRKRPVDSNRQNSKTRKIDTEDDRNKVKLDSSLLYNVEVLIAKDEQASEEGPPLAGHTCFMLTQHYNDDAKVENIGLLIMIGGITVGTSNHRIIENNGVVVCRFQSKYETGFSYKLQPFDAIRAFNKFWHLVMPSVGNNKEATINEVGKSQEFDNKSISFISASISFYNSYSRPYGNKCIPCVIVTGGTDMNGKVRKDGWILSLTGKIPNGIMPEGKEDREENYISKIPKATTDIDIKTLANKLAKNAQFTLLEAEELFKQYKQLTPNYISDLSILPSLFINLGNSVRWAFTTIGNLLENSLAKHLNCKKISIELTHNNNGKVTSIIIQDDGIGLDYIALHKLLKCFGKELHNKDDSSLTFKLTFGRLSSTVCVFTRTKSAVGAGLISLQLLSHINSESVVAPVCMWALPTKHVISCGHPSTDLRQSQRLLMSYSPFKSPTAIAEQVNILGVNTGTRLIFSDIRTDLTHIIYQNDSYRLSSCLIDDRYTSETDSVEIEVSPDLPSDFPFWSTASDSIDYCLPTYIYWCFLFNPIEISLNNLILTPDVSQDSEKLFNNCLYRYLSNKLFYKYELQFLCKADDGFYGLIGFISNPLNKEEKSDLKETGILLYYKERLIKRLNGSFPMLPSSLERRNRRYKSFKPLPNIRFMDDWRNCITCVINVADWMKPAPSNEYFLHEGTTQWFQFCEALEDFIYEYLVEVQAGNFDKWIKSRGN